MSQKFSRISDLQKHLKNSILEAFEHKVTQVVINTIRDNILKRVYFAYTPQGDFAYERTYELLDAISITGFTAGTKHITLEISMDASKISSYVTAGYSWNQHADIWGNDVSEYIPLWIEEGTEGSLWDRSGSYYMANSYNELTRESRVTKVLAEALRREGWNVVVS